MGCTLKNVRRGGVGDFVCVLSLVTLNRRARGHAVKYKCLRSIHIVNHAAQLQRVLHRLVVNGCACVAGCRRCCRAALRLNATLRPTTYRRLPDHQGPKISHPLQSTTVEGAAWSFHRWDNLRSALSQLE